MSLLLEALQTTVLSLYYILEAIVLFFVPFSWRRKNVKGQRVLITGAGSGLGRLMSHEFAKLGCTLILVDVNKAGNEETATSLRERHGVSAHPFSCDLSKREDIYRVMDQIKREVGDIDILINNAGIVTGLKIMQCPDSMMEKTMQVNTMAHFWTIKSVLPAMLERNSGHIVNIASIAGQVGVAGMGDYSASKFAVVGLDEALRMELSSLKKTGVHTTVVCPYFINTGMFDGVTTKFPLIFPIQDPVYAVNRIVDGVLCNQEIVLFPRICYIIVALKYLVPTKLMTLCCEFCGFLVTMDTYRGRDGKQK